MKFLDWLFAKPYALISSHAAVEDMGGTTILHAQAVIEAKHPIGAAINIHLELHDEDGQVIMLPLLDGTEIEAKKTAKNIHLHKGASTLIEWNQAVNPEKLPRHLNLKVGVWSADYQQTLAWYSVKSWSWHPRW